MSSPAGPVVRLRAALEANRCEVHLATPAELPENLAALASSVAAGAPVAAAPGTGPESGPSGEAAVGPSIRRAIEVLAGDGAEVITPGEPSWAARLPAAGVGITGADAAAAAEGVMALRCGPTRPRATSLVPPVHLCVVPESVVEPDFEAALARALTGRPPSALTWIGGPSRTGDLEMRTTMGVHGPLRVVAVIAVDL